VIAYLPVSFYLCASARIYLSKITEKAAPATLAAAHCGEMVGMQSFMKLPIAQHGAAAQGPRRMES
jgi:hypothetical protein